MIINNKKIETSTVSVLENVLVSNILQNRTF